MSKWEYWEERIEKAARTGIVLLKEHNRHSTHVRKSPKRSFITPHERERILSLHKLKMSISQICGEVGRAKSSVWQVIKDNGGADGQ